MSQLAAREIHLAPNGNDHNRRRGTPAAIPALATGASGGQPDTPIQMLHTGWYLDQPIVFTAEDSGTEHAQILGKQHQQPNRC